MDGSNPLFELNDLSFEASRMIADKLGERYELREDSSGFAHYSTWNGLEFETLYFGPAHLLPSFLLAPRG
jgi:hypothetical protein